MKVEKSCYISIENERSMIIKMNLCSIASSSSGNCIYIGNEQTSLLVDVGISKKRVEAGLKQIDINPSSLNGILITHEHSDHISGLGVLLRRYQIPVYATEETICAIFQTKSIGTIPKQLFHIIYPDKEFIIQDMVIQPFSISHDANNPVCYTFVSGGHKVGIATDLGKYDDYIISNLINSEILFLEANHDIHMLEVGAYPYMLKRRILGEKGHLSNDNTGKLICHLLHDNLKYIFLEHLSKENNYPDLAYETVHYELIKECKENKPNIKLAVADREQPSELVCI